MKRPITLALALLVVGAAMLALAAGQTWVTARLPPADLLGGATRSRPVPLTGNQLSGGLSALAVAALAAGAALCSTRGRGRMATAGLTALIGVAALALSVHVLAAASTLAAASSQVVAVARSGAAARVPTSTTGWPALGLLAAALVAAAGMLAARGARVSQGLPVRYESPRVAAQPTVGSGQAAGTDVKAQAELAAWSALDRGEDPTARVG